MGLGLGFIGLGLANPNPNPNPNANPNNDPTPNPNQVWGAAWAKRAPLVLLLSPLAQLMAQVTTRRA